MPLLLLHHRLRDPRMRLGGLPRSNDVHTDRLIGVGCLLRSRPVRDTLCLNRHRGSCRETSR